MKVYKNINVFLDGSCYLSDNIEAITTKKFVNFQKHNNKNFILNTKISNINNIFYQSFYKKKYLKFGI